MIRKLLLMLLCLCPILARAQSVFSCGSVGTAFATTGPCGVNTGGQPFWNVNQAALSGSRVLMLPQSTTHNVGTLIYQTKENVQAFSTTFTFQPDGQNISLFIQNSDNNPGFDGNVFAGGAGGEAGFYQGFGGTAPPNKIFAVLFDSYGGNSAGSNTFTYSSLQWYQSAQSPANDNVGGPYFGTNKLSTSPVSLNSPTSTVNTCLQTVSGTCDTYSTTIKYDGSNLTVTLYDVTAGGSCPGASCFTQSFTNVFVPSIVAGTTAYVGIASASGTISNPYPLYLNSWSYTVETPTGTPTTVAYNAATSTNNGTQSVVSPTYSVAGGTYSSTQTVTISESSPNSYVCFSVVPPGTIPATYPQPSNNATSSNPSPPCASGTKYTGPISISSSSTLYAAGGTTWGGNGGSPVAGLPSPLVAATYTISGSGTAAAPTFSPGAGTYPGSQTVTASTSTSGCGPYIYFDTNATPVTQQTTLTVATSEKVYAYVHACPGYADSSISSAVYGISGATGDGRGPQSEPTFPTGCTQIQATKTLAPSTSLNVDPFNSCISTPGVLGGTGGCSLEPNSEVLDNTTAGGGAGVQTTIDSTSTGDCVELVMGSSGQDAFVLAPWVPKNSAGGAVKVIVDAGVDLKASRNPNDYGGGTCGQIPGSCGKHWIEPSGVANIFLGGYGQLDGRCWDKYTTGGNGFCSNRVQSYCNNQASQGKGWQWQGISCPDHSSSSGAISYGPDMIHAKGSNSFTIYKLGLIHPDNFDTYWGDGGNGFTVWGAKVIAPFEVSNSDGIDPSYDSQNVTISDTIISVGDNTMAWKSDNGTRYTAGIMKNGTVQRVQTGAGIGLTIGANTSGGISNILFDGITQRGNVNHSQSVGAGINSGKGQGGLVNLVTFENVCQVDEATSMLIGSSYNASPSGQFPHYTNINVYNWHTLKGTSGNSGAFTIEGYDAGSNKMGLTLNNMIVDAAVSGSGSNKNVAVIFGPDPVSTAIQNTLPNGTRGISVTNNISNSNPAFPCNNATWQQLIGELSLSTSGNNNAQGLTVAGTSATYTLQAVIRPTTDINTKEQPNLTDGSPPFVKFYEDGSLLGSGNIGANGTFATYGPITRSGPATHIYTANYPGDSFYSSYTFGNPGTNNQVIVNITGGAGVVAQPTFSPNGTSFNPTIAVSMATATAGATICYTTDGSTPAASTPGTCSHGTTYSTAITLSSTTTLKALATLSAETNSSVYSQTYTLSATPTVATPVFTPPTSTFSGSLTVSISCSTPGNTIYYTTDGTTPTTGSPVYSAPFSITTTTTVQALASASGYTNSAVGAAVYTSSNITATPTFSPLSGAFTGTISVAISDTTPSSSIYYTTDGSTPTTGSTLYTGPISVSTTTLVQAIAAAAGLSNSAVGAATYTLSGGVPQIIPGPQKFATTLVVAITGPGVIHYTTNGTTPNSGSPVYTGAFTISSTTIVQAISIAGGTTSLPAIVTYTQAPCTGCWWDSNND